MIWLPLPCFRLRNYIYEYISGSLLSVSLKRNEIQNLISIAPLTLGNILRVYRVRFSISLLLPMLGDACDDFYTHARFERGEVDRTKMKRTSWLRRRKQEPAALWVAGESQMHFCINNISCPLLSSSLYAWKRIHFMLRYIVEIKNEAFVSLSEWFSSWASGVV